MKYKLMQDLSAISSIRSSVLSKLVDISEACLCDYLVEAKSSHSSCLEVNIGIGKLVFLLYDNSIEYRFVPSSKFEQHIIKSLSSMKSPLLDTLETNLEDKILSTYKDIF